jgi:hypothetical protein
MRRLMMVLRMWIFCLMLVGDVISCLLCIFCLLFFIFMSLCIFHLSEWMRCMPRYV